MDWLSKHCDEGSFADLESGDYHCSVLNYERTEKGHFSGTGGALYIGMKVPFG